MSRYFGPASSDCRTRLAGQLATQVRQHAQSSASALSDREAQILRLIADGESVPDIATELFVAQTTVKTHIRRLYVQAGFRVHPSGAPPGAMGG